MYIVFFQFFWILIYSLLIVAFLTLLERKVLGRVQKRKGPNVVGISGLLQPLADGFKLVVKEGVIPNVADKFVFIIAPLIFLGSTLALCSMLPVNDGVVLIDSNMGLLVVYGFMSLSLYGILLGGWSGNSRYSMLGALRSSAQMVSYEVGLGLVLVSVVLTVESMNITEIVNFQKECWLIFPLFPVFIFNFICMLAETARIPFDLPEAEAELVSGYNVEYGASGFAEYFIGEYVMMVVHCVLMSLIFFGGWFSPIPFLFSEGQMWVWFKVIVLLLSIMLIRASLPRFRADQLMYIGWQVILPLIFVFFSYIVFIEKSGRVF